MTVGLVPLGLPVERGTQCPDYSQLKGRGTRPVDNSSLRAQLCWATIERGLIINPRLPTSNGTEQSFPFLPQGPNGTEQSFLFSLRPRKGL